MIIHDRGRIRDDQIWEGITWTTVRVRFPNYNQDWFANTELELPQPA